ncbi:hypothetical protein F3Y22_tig00111393pilonHSYRG00009 [Hibiscus syriacus]|uniref:Uncharacterized protein n=1 Tax=Hibiscus syriacus TaxID=106335 RepID=A0A6A2YK04_HIBSY|nr:hypothetical protein F3Y22_tig00111393pilonHSYRG00009 [Hibiscus syriacus]
MIEEELGLEKGEIGRKLTQLGILNEGELGILKEEGLENEKVGEQITVEAGVEKELGSAEANTGLSNGGPSRLSDETQILLKPA